MYKPSDAKRGLCPQPVYEGHFSNGMVLRMSFFQLAGKPWDFERGRKLMENYAMRHDCELVSGFVEHDDTSKPWTRIADTMETAAKRTRKPSAKIILRLLLDHIDGKTVNDNILQIARDIAA